MGMLCSGVSSVFLVSKKSMKFGLFETVLIQSEPDKRGFRIHNFETVWWGIYHYRMLYCNNSSKAVKLHHT